MDDNRTSRILVKNLPKHITRERIMSHFSIKGAITDIKMMKDCNGVFRRFAFVGFTNEKVAEDSISYFNNTFVDTCRITVEFAKPIGDSSIPRPWSKHSLGSSAHQKLHQISQKNDVPKPKKESKSMISLLKEAENDPKFQEFLDVMRPRGAAKFHTWANDDFVGVPSNPTDLAKIAGINTADDDLYQDLPSTETKSVITNTANDSSDTLASSSIAHDSSVSDMEYLKSRMKNAFNEDAAESPFKAPDETEALEIKDSQKDEYVETDNEITAGSERKSRIARQIMDLFENPESDMPERAIAKIAEESPETPVAPPAAEIIAETGRLFIKNLPYTCSEDDLKDLFEKFGPLSEIHISIDKLTKKSRGFAFILYLLPEHAVNAYAALDNSIFQGRIIEIVPGKEKQNEEEILGPDAAFKKKVEAKRKKESQAEYSWNSLFMNSDAIAAAMAKKLNIKKSDILDPNAENMAVRLAQAETDIINDTKQYLIEQGINLDAFSPKSNRSNTVILVKNIPSTTTLLEIEKLFEKFGTLGRVILPPSCTIAMVEFLEQNEAKSAFKKLSYSKFKHLPLFLEYAPMDVFSREYDPESDQKSTERSRKSDAQLKVEATTSADLDDPDEMPVSTVFVKNLNFTTTNAALKEKFQDNGGLKSVRISTKTHPKTGEILSMGFGFIEFETKSDAVRAIKVFQGTEIDGHKLQLKFSNAAKKQAPKKTEEDEVKITGTKLIIRNIPFQASKKDIHQLFSTFGEVKSVRLPKKFDGTHRGFGFVDFLTKQEAKAAFSTLGSTHLYGRHLVMEWAENEATIETLRSKTAKTYFEGDQGLPVGKRHKVTLEE